MLSGLSTLSTSGIGAEEQAVARLVHTSIPMSSTCSGENHLLKSSLFPKQSTRLYWKSIKLMCVSSSERHKIWTRVP